MEKECYFIEVARESVLMRWPSFRDLEDVRVRFMKTQRKITSGCEMESARPWGSGLGMLGLSWEKQWGKRDVWAEVGERRKSRDRGWNLHLIVFFPAGLCLDLQGITPPWMEGASCISRPAIRTPAACSCYAFLIWFLAWPIGFLLPHSCHRQVSGSPGFSDLQKSAGGYSAVST